MKIDVQQRVDKARENFEKGYNCCQSVVLAFNDLFGLDDETAARTACGLGGGVGRMREVCGCVSGMAMLAGFVLPQSGKASAAAKSENYAFVQELANAFKTETGSIICSVMLGLDNHTPSIPQASERTPEYYKKRPCKELVALAAKLFAEKLSELQAADVSLDFFGSTQIG